MTIYIKHTIDIYVRVLCMVIYVIQRAYNWQYSWELYTDIDNVPCGDKRLEFGSGHVSLITRYGKPAKPIPLDEGVHLATWGSSRKPRGRRGAERTSRAQAWGPEASRLQAISLWLCVNVACHSHMGSTRCRRDTLRNFILPFIFLVFVLQKVFSFWSKANFKFNKERDHSWKCECCLGKCDTIKGLLLSFKAQ